jgi:hypothetical protein
MRAYRLPQYSMTITWHDLTRLERRPDIILDLFRSGILANFGLHLLDPDEDFLISKATKKIKPRDSNMKRLAYPWRGPARPLSEAPKERKGSERVEPTSLPV